MQHSQDQCSLDGIRHGSVMQKPYWPVDLRITEGMVCTCGTPSDVEPRGKGSHLMAFQTSSSDFCLGISSVQAGAAVSSVCFSPCLCRLVRPGTGDTGGSAVCACCFGNIASAAGTSHALLHLCPSSVDIQWAVTDSAYNGSALTSCSQRQLSRWPRWHPLQKARPACVHAVVCYMVMAW